MNQAPTTEERLTEIEAQAARIEAKMDVLIARKEARDAQALQTGQSDG